MYCNNCGQQNTDDSIFCAGCGTRLATAEVTEVQRDVVPAAPYLSEVPVQTDPVSGLTSQAAHEKRITKSNRKWPILAAVGFIIVAACLMILFFLMKERPAGEWIMPLLYRKDDVVYITAGKDSIALPDAHLVEHDRLNATIDSDRNYLYYLSETSGEPQLMRLKLNDSKAIPELCAEDVHYAYVSEDGNRVLLIKEVKNFAGELIVWQDGKETKIAESVSVMGFGFSPNGKNICFYTIDPNEDTGRTLFVKTGGKEPVQVAADQNDTILQNAFVFDDGSVFYIVKESQFESGSIMYRYAKGNSERIGAGKLIAAFSSSEWLIEDEDALYYYASGQRERISRDASNLSFAVPWYYLADLRQIPDKHFAFAENKDDSEFVLCECEPGKQLVEIIETDNDRFSIDRSFQWLEYTNEDDSLYLIQKNDKTWGNRVKVETDVYASTFDDNGDYLYYTTYDGDFSRYDLNAGKTEDLFEEVEYFRLIGKRIFVITEDQELFLISSDRNQLVTEDALNLHETFQGGMYIVSEGDPLNIDYLSGKNATVVPIVEDADELISLQGFIVYRSDDFDNDGADEDDVLPTESSAETALEPTQETTEVPTTEPVQSIIPDSNLENGIRMTLDNEGKSLVDSVLTESDLQQLTTLYLPHSSMPWDYHPDGSIVLENTILDLSGIEYATNLTELYIPGHAIERIDVLTGLTQLELLNISFSNVDDIEAIRTLTQLKHLAIGPAVSDLSPIYELVLLESLELNGPTILEIDGLAELQSLKLLALIDTQVSEIQVVEQLLNLEMLALNNTDVIDLSVLQGVETLTHLFVDQATYDANLETIGYLEESGCEVIATGNNY